MTKLITLLTVIVATTLGGHGVTGSPKQCPLATIRCNKVDGTESKYHCFTATTAVPNHSPQFQWRVSAGRIIGSRKSDELFIYARDVKTKTITVTLKVHWKNFFRICDRTVTETIDLP
jgi:hypothetical protein